MLNINKKSDHIISKINLKLNKENNIQLMKLYWLNKTRSRYMSRVISFYKIVNNQNIFMLSLIKLLKSNQKDINR